MTSSLMYRENRDTPMSENRLSITAKVPLTAQKQWETLMAHHCGRWQGILVRYDAAGQVLDLLDSVRSFIPSDDRQTVTHSLDFRSRMTETVMQKQWVLTLGNPLIIHPVDPDAYLLFNPDSPDIMVGRDRTGSRFYFEPYLLASGKRTSVVVMYKSAANSPQPNMFSFFREIKEGGRNLGGLNKITVKLIESTASNFLLKRQAEPMFHWRKWLNCQFLLNRLKYKAIFYKSSFQMPLSL